MSTFRRVAGLFLLSGALTLSAAPLALAQHGDHGDEEPGIATTGDDEGTELGTDEEHEHEHGTPEISWFSPGPEGEPAFFGRILAFAIWLGILVYYGRGPISAFLGARRKAILDGLEEAKRVEAAAQAKHEEYTARIENLDAEIAKLRKDFERAGMEERDRMVAEASAKANRMLEEAKFLVDQQMKTLREELTRESIDAAVAAAEKILRERATGADQQRLADEYLARLKSSVASATKGAQS